MLITARLLGSAGVALEHPALGRAAHGARSGGTAPRTTGSRWVPDRRPVADRGEGSCSLHRGRPLLIAQRAATATGAVSTLRNMGAQSLVRTKFTGRIAGRSDQRSVRRRPGDHPLPAVLPAADRHGWADEPGCFRGAGLPDDSERKWTGFLVSTTPDEEGTLRNARYIPPARTRLRSPPRELRQHDHPRDDRQPRQTPPQRNHPSLAVRLKPHNT